MENLSQSTILEILRSEKKTLEETFGVTKIALFGSFARNEQHAESDVDILIEAKIHRIRNRLGLKKYLEEKFNRKVDVGYFSSVRSYIMNYIEEDMIYA